MKYKGFKKEEHFDRFSFYNGDCMELMRQTPDKYYDLAIVDPVFGDLVVKGGYMSNSSSKMAKNKQYNNALWKQEKTTEVYFKELFRISKNQIIWGGNYFVTEIGINKSCWIVWDKQNGENHFADCELAWTSFNTAVRKFKWKWQGMLQENMKNKQQRIHPTEKPIELYEFCLKNYAKPNQKILDTHGGSMSIAHAIDKANKLDNMNLEFVGIELNTGYFDAALKRFKFSRMQSCFKF